jgi:hypothetical protein
MGLFPFRVRSDFAFRPFVQDFVPGPTMWLLCAEKETRLKSFFALLLLSPVVFAQSNPPSPPAQAQQPRFEIADVHVSKTAPGFAQSFGGTLHDGGLYINRDATMLNLIVAAYGVPEDVVAGGPGWIASDLFDVIAKVPDGTTMATGRYIRSSGGLNRSAAGAFRLVCAHQLQLASGSQSVDRNLSILGVSLQFKLIQ